MKVQLHFLKLAYPPISNQEAEWLKDDLEVREEIKHSNLYMIAQRHESKFIIDEQSVFPDFINEFSLKFIYSIGEYSTEVIIDFGEVLKYHDVNLEDVDLEFEFGEKLIRIWACKVGSKERLDVIDWFTTEKILYDKWHGHPAIKGFANHRDFSKYYLHYVGISKSEDSLSRLVIKPHDKRLRILSNESPKRFSSRVTDEIILFFFRVDPLLVHRIDNENDIEDLLNGIGFDNTSIVADAEKAFIKILDSQYNKVKYHQYPKGTDGLYDHGLKRYGYAIGEDITFITDTQEIVGDYNPRTQFADNADLILVEGDKVSFIKEKGE